MPMEKTFSPAEAEARISDLWIDRKVGAAGANAKPGAEAFSVMIPPPNVTGSLHIGHAFNNTLQDILVRWHRMRGFNVLWQVGTDHAGIATQMVTERDMALHQEPNRRTMGREAFTQRVWQQKKASRGTIIGQLQRLGATCDWDREAFTMSGAPGAPAGEDGNFHDAVIKVFVQMYDDKLIYRGKRLVNWDPHFETAISDLEVENIEVAGHMWHFKYILADGETYEYVEKDANGAVTLREVRDYISIATTRPETMLGDGAVAVHPSDVRYAAIVGKMVEIPIKDDNGKFRQIPVIVDEYPDPTFGSGAVKITGAHDHNDHAVAERHRMTMHILMDTKANMRDDKNPDNIVPTRFQGMHRFIKDGVPGAREAIVAEINALGLCVSTLVKSIDPETGSEHLTREPVVESKKIMQPHGDRSKVVIEPMLTDQWFVDTARIVGPALDAVRNGDTRIIPESGEKTYFHWLENIEPWCISRQLWWGHQIPVWYARVPDNEEKWRNLLNINELLMSDSGASPSEIASAEAKETDFKWIAIQISAPTEQDALEAIRKQLPFELKLQIATDEWFERTSSTIGPMPDSEGQLTALVWRDPDVLDTWFSSGLWPIGTLGWPNWTPATQKYFPTSTLITGADIIFFWVARMMMMQLAVVDQVPFKTVYLHGLVRDAKGKKMSKSLGNVVDPLAVIDEFGADALRFSNAAMASLGGVLKLDTQRIAGYRNFGTKLWNACRFAEMNGVWEGHKTGPAPSPTATVNKWIISEVSRVALWVDKSLEKYRFDEAADHLYTLVWGKVCDWYVEFAKPLFDGPYAQETRATMAWVLDQCMILLHPLMPFVTEELWKITGDRNEQSESTKHLLVHTDWPSYQGKLTDPLADGEMRWVIQVIDEIRSARAQMHVPVGLKLDMLSLQMDDNAIGDWNRNEALIKRLARIESLTAADTAPKGAITIAVNGATFAIPLAGIIDIAEEKSRLTKAIDKLAKEITGLDGRLNNPNFAISAPEDVVAEARANRDARMVDAAKLQAALNRLAEIA